MPPPMMTTRGIRRPPFPLWGRMESCGGLSTRLQPFADGRTAPVGGVPSGSRAGYHPAPHSEEPAGRKRVAHGAQPWVAGDRRLSAPERGVRRIAAFVLP